MRAALSPCLGFALVVWKRRGFQVFTAHPFHTQTHFPAWVCCKLRSRRTWRNKVFWASVCCSRYLHLQRERMEKEWPATCCQKVCKWTNPCWILSMMLQVVYILSFVGQSIHPFGLHWRDGGFMPGLLGFASF